MLFLSRFFAFFCGVSPGNPIVSVSIISAIYPRRTQIPKPKCYSDPEIESFSSEGRQDVSEPPFPFPWGQTLDPGIFGKTLV